MRPSRIILISIDALRADHLGCYGYTRNTSPNIDGLAAASIVFKKAFTPCTYTVPTHSALLTGKYPGNISTFFWQDEGELETDREIMVQEILAEKGYETAAFVGAAVLRKEWGLNSGFRIYDDDVSTEEINRPGSLYRSGEDTNKKLFRWLESNVDKDFFCWVHYFDVHGPYVVPEPYGSFFKPEDYGASPLRLPIVDEGCAGGIPRYQALGARKDKDGNIVEYIDDARAYLAGYDDGVRYADHVIGQLLDELNRAGIYDDTTIIITADHGEALGEDDVYFFHGLTVTPEQTHVPLLLKLPRQDMAGTLIEEPVSTIDVMPTILEIAGIKGRTDLDAVSLLSRRENRVVLCENEWQKAIIEKDYYLIDRKKAIRDGFSYYFDSIGLCAKKRLYRYADDIPVEVAGEAPEAASLFSTLFSQFAEPREITIRAKDIDIKYLRKRAAELERQVSANAALELKLREQENELRTFREQMESSNVNLQRILNSFSWKLTSPLRWVSARLKGL